MRIGPDDHVNPRPHICCCCCSWSALGSTTSGAQIDGKSLALPPLLLPPLPLLWVPPPVGPKPLALPPAPLLLVLRTVPLPLLLMVLSTGVGGGSSAGGSGADPAIGTISLEVDPGVDVCRQPLCASVVCLLISELN